MCSVLTRRAAITMRDGYVVRGWGGMERGSQGWQLWPRGPESNFWLTAGLTSGAGLPCPAHPASFYRL